MARPPKEPPAAPGDTHPGLPRALLIDTHSLFVRAVFAVPEMTSGAGMPTSALDGLSVLVLKLLREQRPLGVAFALDTGKPTFRHARWPAYKAQRAPLASALGAQFALLPRLLDALGAPRFAAPGFEADDVLATLAHELSAGGTPVRVVSGGHDLFQVIDEREDVLFVGARGQSPKLSENAALPGRIRIPPMRN